MSLWKRVQELPQERREYIYSLYDEIFPSIVRSNLADFIESEACRELRYDDSQHQLYAENFRNTIIEKLREQNKCGVELASSINNLVYNKSSISLVNKLAVNLQAELNEVIYEMGKFGNNKIHSGGEILECLQILKRQMNESEYRIRIIEYEQREFLVQNDESLKRERHLRCNRIHGYIDKIQSDKQRIDAALRCKMTKIEGMIQRWICDINQSKTAIEAIQKYINNSVIPKWKRGQQLEAIGFKIVNNIIEIEEWCEAIADLLLQIMLKSEHMKNICNRMPSTDFFTYGEEAKVEMRDAESLLIELVKCTFLVEQQPPQVIRTSTLFNCTVRLLVGRVLGVQMYSPEVTIHLVNETEAQRIFAMSMNHSGASQKIQSSGVILNKDSKLNVEEDSYSQVRKICASFEKMKIKSINRGARKETDFVTEEKFALCFASKIKFGNLEINIFALSLPISVTVHANQESKGLCTIVWDNAFSKPVRTPFDVPKEVTWKELSEVLRTYFIHTTGAKRELSADHIAYLGARVLKRDPKEICEDSRISWKQFGKEQVKEAGSTFWEWFQAACKLLNESFLKTLWNHNLIVGFISRQATEKMLEQSPMGTFLIRFSDSIDGSLTIAFVDVENKVLMLEPWNLAALKTRCLYDRISDIKELAFIYPESHKDTLKNYLEAKSEERSNASQQRNNYLKIVMRAEIYRRHKSCNSERLLSMFPSPPTSIDGDEVMSINEINPDEFGEIDIDQYMEDASVLSAFQETFPFSQGDND